MERLAPQLRQKLRGHGGSCPDAETLCAVIEGEAPQPERDTVMAHLAQCADCSDLQSRLLNFEQEIEPEPEMAWNQTRTRLDNWLEGFLRSEAAGLHRSQKGFLSDRVSIREGIRDFFTSRKIVWTLSVAAGLVLIVDGVLFLRHRQEQTPPAQVAARPTVPPNPPQRPPETQGKTPGQEGLRAAGNNPPLSPENPHRPDTVEPIAPGGPALGNATAACPTCPTVGGPAHPPPALPQNTTPVTAPPRLRLDPANRLFIVLSSIHIDPNGSFQFHGTLVLPVSQSGPIPLDRGAEVLGVGTMSQGQTSLSVTELKVQAGRYRLKDGTGAMNAQTPGGNGVDFHRSQVLDMWPVARAVYEKVPDTIEPHGPQK